MKIAVTGASSGIGRALWDQLPGALALPRYTMLGIGREGPEVHCDLATNEGLETAIRRLIEYRPDLLINNAGCFSFSDGDLSKSPLDCAPELHRMVGVNLLAVYWICRQVGAVMKGGLIVNIASVSASGEPDAPLYGATKAGVVSLTRAFASRLAPQGVRVNSISPGFFKSNLCGGGPLPPELLQKIRVGREAAPYEIIPIFEMMIRTPYMTGADVVVDGGYSLR